MKETLVFTDGASRGNPGSSGWGAVIAHDGQVVELGGGIPEGTNNQMELTAVIEALEWLQGKEVATVSIYSDSTYTISGATGWVFSWDKRGWQTKDGDPIKNKELWQRYYELQKTLEFEVNFHKVKGHASIPANERADDVATSFADGEIPDLKNVSQADYGVSLNPTAQYLEKSPVYFSFVGGEARMHATWPECQKWVAGKQAQYRKVRTVVERDELLREWGVDLAAVKK
ncbi:MAG: ribonuclease H [Candidatus Paceibacterota bacterium]